MSAVIERYQVNARDYQRYWAPVLEATSATLVDYIEWYAGGPPDGTPTVVDVGTGTGSLARAVLERWPRARVVATDAAAAMLDIVAEQTSRFGPRVAIVTGPADTLPLADQSADMVVSSFVFQLVPNRRAALREAYRLLRPGGLLAYVTWLDRELRAPFRPMEEFDEAVLELRVEEPAEPRERCAGDVPSAAAAAAQLRRSGFREAITREDELDYHWTRESYLEYKLAYDERSLLGALDEADRDRLEHSARARLARLPDDAFHWHPPIVFAAARRPAV